MVDPFCFRTRLFSLLQLLVFNKNGFCPDTQDERLYLCCFTQLTVGINETLFLFVVLNILFLLILQLLRFSYGLNTIRTNTAFQLQKGFRFLAWQTLNFVISLFLFQSSPFVLGTCWRYPANLGGWHSKSSRVHHRAMRITNHKSRGTLFVIATIKSGRDWSVDPEQTRSVLLQIHKGVSVSNSQSW